MYDRAPHRDWFERIPDDDADAPPRYRYAPPPSARRPRRVGPRRAAAAAGAGAPMGDEDEPMWESLDATTAQRFDTLDFLDFFDLDAEMPRRFEIV